MHGKKNFYIIEIIILFKYFCFRFHFSACQKHLIIVCINDWSIDRESYMYINDIIIKGFYLNNKMFSLVNNSVYEGGDIAEKCMTCLNGLSTFSAVIAIVIQFITYAMVTKMLTCL